MFMQNDTFKDINYACILSYSQFHVLNLGQHW